MIIVIRYIKRQLDVINHTALREKQLLPQKTLIKSYNLIWFYQASDMHMFQMEISLAATSSKTLSLYPLVRTYGDPTEIHRHKQLYLTPT